MKIAIIIPAFRAEKQLPETLSEWRRSLSGMQPKLTPYFVVVDDGSPTPLREMLDSNPDWLGIPSEQRTLLRHLINLGQGAALHSGIQYAARRLPDIELFATVDADGQHRPEDLPAFVRAITSDPSLEIVFGNRWTSGTTTGMPTSRRILLTLASLFERLLTGLPLEDAHNGYRVFRRTVAEALTLRMDRMAHATEIKQIVARSGFKFGEVPVGIRYSEETLAHGQSNLGSLLILRDLIRHAFFGR